MSSFVIVVHIIAIFLLFCVLTVINISEMHAKLVVRYSPSYTGSSPIVGLVSRYHVIQVKSDNGKGVYCERLSTYIFDTTQLKVIFLLNCESSKYIAKLFSLSIYLLFVFSCSQYWHFMGSADDTRLKQNDIKMVWNKME